MPFNHAQLTEDTLVQPRGVTKKVEAVKLCTLDLKRPTLTERVAVLFTFPRHLSTAPWQRSLSDLLEKYPVCCGRLQFDGKDGYIACNSAGIPFYEAVRADAVSAHDAALPATAIAFTQVIDAEQMLTGQEALLKVQVTHCGDNQTMLGITIAQVLSDLTGLVDLLKDWMKLHQQQLSQGLPEFDRQVVQPGQKIDKRHPSSSILQLLGLFGAYIIVMFQFLWQGAFSAYPPTVLVIPSPTLQDFKDRINSLPLSGPYRLSSNDLLCSILWHVSCLVRDRTGSSGTFYLPFDLRQMHVPDAYFGNAHSMLSVLDPDRAPIDTTSVSKEETEVSVVLTARLVRRAVVDARNEGKSAQEVSQQLKSPSSTWLSRTATLSDRVINHDASLASWQELYRLVSTLDFGAGMPIGLATVRQVTSPAEAHQL
ncbi:TPA: hypothetical protein ACH3X1_004081 [Trebouxia sp. C0004]